MAERVGFVVHAGRDEAKSAARIAAKVIGEAGAQVVVCAGDAWARGTLAELGLDERSPATFADGLDVIVVFGGDGTFLRAAWMARDCQVPLIGVNLGRLGFLSEIEAEDVPTALQRLLSGEFAIEERMTLTVAIHDAQGAVVARSWALNEASVERTVPQRLIVLRLEVGGTVLTDVPADALVCATPTGSTAYAFSAGGPILAPTLRAMVVVPVAPHSLFDRTLVLQTSERVRITPIGGDNVCVVSLDGRESIRVPDGGYVTVSAGELPVRLARLAAFDFYARLRSKFGLG
jgi:NAD+ kinase